MSPGFHLYYEKGTKVNTTTLLTPQPELPPSSTFDATAAMSASTTGAPFLPCPEKCQARDTSSACDEMLSYSSQSSLLTSTLGSEPLSSLGERLQVVFTHT